ncbi:MAG: hypothetical protein QM770_15185 [Tepidisphaeraceae bacterium]
MSTTADTHAHAPDAHHGHGHDPHLAHHFESLDQQFSASKLGMWTFLATEILMFGGLFVLYSVFRANHPAVYLYAHSALQTNLGAINTAILLASSFTMAWGVRAAQLGQRSLMIGLIALTFMGGIGFMTIKYFEYTTKIKYALWVGEYNAFNAKFVGDPKGKLDASEHILVHKLEHAGLSEEEADKKLEVIIGGHGEGAPAGEHGATPEKAPEAAPAVQAYPAYMLPAEPKLADNAPDAAKHTPVVDALKPPAGVPSGTIPADAPAPVLTYNSLQPFDQARVLQFFSIYYMMTGLHGLHVLVGMGLMVWLLHRGAPAGLRVFITPTSLLLLAIGCVLATVHGGLGINVGGYPLTGSLAVIAFILAAASLGINLLANRKPVNPEGEFGPTYFTPVDLGGLYWHLVDLIWIFLFPLLYLIH